jgi:hypothetical protein
MLFGISLLKPKLASPCHRTTIGYGPSWSTAMETAGFDAAKIWTWGKSGHDEQLIPSGCDYFECEAMEQRVAHRQDSTALKRKELSWFLRERRRFRGKWKGLRWLW